MQRDMELIRKILFAIEKEYVDVWLDYDDLKIEGYDFKTVGYHCSILYDAGLVYDYKGQYAENELCFFGVGRLTWEGHEFLDKIRSDTVWNKTKETIADRGIPFVMDVVKEVAASITTAMVKAATGCM